MRHARTMGRWQYVAAAVLLAGIVVQAYRIARHMIAPGALHHGAHHIVFVDGNVERPGQYRVPEGTSRFELLKVAGLRATSDISALSLGQEVDARETVSVGTLSSPAALDAPVLSGRLEFLQGEVYVASETSSVTAVEAGMLLTAGQQITTDSASQAEVSIGPYTRIDVDQLSQLTLESLGTIEKSSVLSSVYQQTGVCWYRVVYTNRNERITVLTRTASITPGGTGADFMVELLPDAARIHALEGQIRVKRLDSEEDVNLVSGRTLTVYRGRPMQVTRTGTTVNTQRRFAGLQKEAANRAAQDAPVNFVFCTLPDNYFYVSVRFDQAKALVISIPAETSVEEFSQGFSTLNQAFLLGGGEYVQGLMEQLLGTRVEKYSVLDKDGLLQIVATIGTLRVPVDDAAARAMGLPPGPQRLSADQIFTFLKPRISGLQGTRQRQQLVLQSLFDAIKSRSLVLNTPLVERSLSVMESNFTIGEVLTSYTKFSTRSGWQLEVLKMPGTLRRVGGRMLFEADRSAVRQVLFGGA